MRTRCLALGLLCGCYTPGDSADEPGDDGPASTGAVGGEDGGDGAPGASTDNGGSTQTSGADASSSDGGTAELQRYWTPVTILAEAIAEPLEDFPLGLNVRVSALREEARGGHVATSTGEDISFYGDDRRTPLDAEVTVYDGDKGKLVAFVRVPQVSTTADTRIWLAYGDAEAPPTPRGEAAWSAAYAAVWHFEQPVGGTFRDSTANGADGVAFAVTDADIDSGRFGNGARFDHPDARMLVEDPQINSVESMTVSGLVRVDGPLSADGRQRIFHRGEALGSQALELWLEDDTLSFGYATTRVNYSTTPTAPIPDFAYGQWHYVTVSYDGTNTLPNNYRLWVDGQELAATNVGAVLRPTSQTFVGNWHLAAADSHGPRNFRGIIDEIRVETVARSDAWLRAEYLNIMEPDAFYLVGAEEQTP